MSNDNRIKLLKLTLRVVGAIFIVGIYSLMSLWPSGWRWHTGESHYPAMILGIYATLGVFLLIASRNPLAHSSLIWFTVWSSVVHAGIMAVQSLRHSDQMGHLWGDVLALFFVAAVLTLLTPRAIAERATMGRAQQIATPATVR
jgi:MFS superfamily sulfate permease-like transporter